MSPLPHACSPRPRRPLRVAAAALVLALVALNAPSTLSARRLAGMAQAAGMGQPEPRGQGAATGPAATAPEITAAAPRLAPPWPDVPLVDQDGRPLLFYADLVRGRRVAMNFVFTTCTTICLPMGANFERLQALLGTRVGSEVRLISVSIDPLTDTPQRLKAWGAKFHAGPGWSLLTGRKEDVDRLLKTLGVFTADRADHAPIALLGDDATGRWTRAYGLDPPAKMIKLLDGLAAPASDERRQPATAPASDPLAPHAAGAGSLRQTAATATTTAPAHAADAAPADAAAPDANTADADAHRYFTDTELIDQDGRPWRFYTDLLAGKTVVIDSFFSRCTGSCPVVAATLAKLQATLGDRLQRDLRLLSISVDPATDTPQRLKEYASRFGARPGWYFLTGSKENVDLVLRKLGQYAEQKEDHNNLLLVGNLRTGLWKKVFGPGRPEDILGIVQGVLDDRGAGAAPAPPAPATPATPASPAAPATTSGAPARRAGPADGA